MNPTSPRAPAILLAVASCIAALAPSPAAAQQLPFEQVIAQLKSADAAKRLAAVKLLRESAYPEAAAPVAPLLSDPDAAVRREALYAELGIFVGASRKDTAAAVHAFEADSAAMPIAPVPSEVVTGLLTPLKGPDAAMRAAAAYSIGVLGQVEGIPPDTSLKTVIEALAERMGDADPSVRIAAARAAGRLFRRCPGGCAILAVDRVGDALVRLLNDPDTAVQGAAFEGIGDLRYERAVKGVGEILAYLKGGEMGWAALDTLARIGHASSVPLFKASLSSRDPNFRRSAVEGLARAGEKGDGAAIDAMIAGERDPAVILAAAFAQHRMGRAAQAPRLVQALGDRRVAPYARDYLIELGTPVAPDVAAALASAPDEARLAMLHVLSVTGTAKQAAAIEPLKKDADPRVAAAAHRALSRIRSFRR